MLQVRHSVSEGPNKYTISLQNPVIRYYNTYLDFEGLDKWLKHSVLVSNCALCSFDSRLHLFLFYICKYQVNSLFFIMYVI